MHRYLARRLLLVIPTVLGITFLVFLLFALAPGGIGAELGPQGGGLDAPKRAAREAYLEDRFGLDDPVLIQYGRWLARVSPLKFGPRDQIDPAGQIVRSPRAIRPPPLAGIWYWQDGVPQEPAPAAILLPDTPDERHRVFLRLSDRYARARAQFIDLRLELESAIRRSRAASGPGGESSSSGPLNESRLAATRLDPEAPEDRAVIETAARLKPAYEEVLAARAKLVGALLATPYREAGVPIVPGWISIASPDLGRTVNSGRSIGSMIGSALPVTLLLNGLAIVLIYTLAVPAGIVAAICRGRWTDRLLGAGLLALWSLPTVWACVLALGFLAHRDWLGWFPLGGLHDADAATMTFLPSRDANSGHWSRGYLGDLLWHLCLPVLCLAYGGMAVLSRQTRAAILDNLNADYVRTARAKGLARRHILFRHVMRNSLLPQITMLASLIPTMLSGSVVIETVFSIPGMGSLVMQAIGERDRELLMANTVMVGVVTVLAMLLADALYAAADPRIRLG